MNCMVHGKIRGNEVKIRHERLCLQVSEKLKDEVGLVRPAPQHQRGPKVVYAKVESLIKICTGGGTKGTREKEKIRAF